MRFAFTGQSSGFHVLIQLTTNRKSAAAKYLPRRYLKSAGI
jgi:hypothetical protein